MNLITIISENHDYLLLLTFGLAEKELKIAVI